MEARDLNCATTAVATSGGGCVCLSALPSELFGLVLRLASCFTARADGSVALPDLASLCQAARAALLDAPELTLRCAHLKHTAHTPDGRRDIVRTWEAQLGVHRAPTAPLRPTVLDLHNLDVHATALCAAFDAAETSGRPLRALALRKCHSVSAAGLCAVLTHAPSLEALVCTGHHLTESTLHALGSLHALRLVCLAECTADADGLTACLPRLRQLRVLMLAGCRLLRDPSGHGGSGVFSLNPPLHPVEAQGETSVGAVPVSDPARAPADWTHPCLGLIEWTFLPSEERQAVQRVAPEADTLDLCAPAASLSAGIAKLRAALAGTALHTGEGGECVSDAAIAAALSARCAGFHETPLHHTANEGDAEAAAVLLDHGAAADIKDAKGYTALARATFWGHATICRLLLAAGADLHKRNHAAESATYLASLRGHPECLRLLLRADEALCAGGRPGAIKCTAAGREYHDGYTPVHAAVISRSVACVKLLLAAGFAPGTQNKYGQSPLHIAASLGGLPSEGIEILLAAGCDVSLRDERNQTAEMVARAKGHEAVARMLASAAKPAAKPAAKHAAKPAAEAAAVPAMAPETAPSGVPEDEMSAKAGGRGGRGRRRRGRGRGRRGNPPVVPVEVDVAA